MSQVWYSSAWKRATHAAFRASLSAALAGAQAQGVGGQPEAVLSLLRHWQARDVPLADSRRAWMESLSRTHFDIANFK